MAKKNKNQNNDLNINDENDILIEEEVLEVQKEDIKVEIIEDDIKEENKIKIIDVSKKREENKKKELYSKLEGFTSNLDFSDHEILAEKVFDSLIFLGGGFLASTNLASKTISSLAEKIVK